MLGAHIPLETLFGHQDMRRMVVSRTPKAFVMDARSGIVSTIGGKSDFAAISCARGQYAKSRVLELASEGVALRGPEPSAGDVPSPQHSEFLPLAE